MTDEGRIRDRTLAPEDIDRLHGIAVDFLSVQMSSGEGRPSDLQLDLGSLSSTLAWEIVVPFLVTVTGGFAVEGIKSWRQSRRQRKATRGEAVHFVGRGIHAESSAELQSCVEVVGEVVSDVGLSKREAAKIVLDLHAAIDIQMGEGEGHQEEPP